MNILAGVHKLLLPLWIEAAWRGVYFVAAICTLAWMRVFLSTTVAMPRSRKMLMAALAVVTVRTMVVQLERWNQPLYLEGLPVDTVWIVLAMVGLARWTRESRT
jgi:hypothetical protein